MTSSEYNLWDLQGLTRDELAAPFWEALQEERLLLPYCEACRAHFFTPQAVCPRCLEAGWRWEESEGNGRVDSYTVVHHSPVSHLEAPFVLAVVRLDEGPFMLAHLGFEELAEARKLRRGERLRISFEPTPAGPVLPLFRVAGVSA